MKKKKGLSMRGKQNATGWGFLAPAIILITLFSLYPMISALITSFQTGTGTNMKFCGFSNYIRCLQDDVFVQSIKNCVFYLIIQVPVMLVLALIQRIFQNSNLFTLCNITCCICYYFQIVICNRRFYQQSGNETWNFRFGI